MQLYSKGQRSGTGNGFDMPETEATADVAPVKELSRKASSLLCKSPVPQTDTGIRDEYSKARGLNLSKELGKLAPYLR